MGAGPRRRAITVFLLSVGAVVVAIAIAACLWLDSRQAGRLAAELARYDQLALAGSRESAQEFRASAKAYMPLVRDDLRARDWPLEIKVKRFLRKFRLRQTVDVSAAARHERGLRLCRILGTNAVSLLPDLERLFYREPQPTNNIEGLAQLRVACAISGAGPEGALVLAHAFSHTNQALRAIAAGALQLPYIGGASDPTAAILQLRSGGLNPLLPEPTIAALGAQLQDSRTQKRLEAVFALGWVSSRPALSLPLLAARMNDPVPAVRRATVESLGFYKRNTNAGALIHVAFADADAGVRTAASNALQHLYPPPPPDYE